LAAGLRVVLHLRRSGTVRSLDEVCVLDGTGPAVQAVAAWRRESGPAAAAGVLARLLADRGVGVPSVVSGQS
jgi:pilus assembly protein CpaF